MRVASRGQATRSNFRADQLAEKTTGNGNRTAKSLSAHTEEVRRLIRTAWPECTAKFLAAEGDISLRQAERILARQKDISRELFWRLMESDEFGFRFYWSILDFLTAKWSPRERDAREDALIDRQIDALMQKKQEREQRRNGGQTT